MPNFVADTSFLALEEPGHFRQGDLKGGIGVNFLEHQEALIVASNKARFGEIEQRGAAVTPKGRQLYNRFLQECQKRTIGVNSDEPDAITTEVLKEYSDTWRELRKQRLIYCHFHCTEKEIQKSNLDLRDCSLLEHLIDNGVVEAHPFTYEDFLPISANLSSNPTCNPVSSPTSHQS